MKAIRILKPQETREFQMRLDWMRDDHPEYLMELYWNGELQAHIIKEVDKANEHYIWLLEQGVEKEVAAEIRTSLFAPEEGLGMRDVPKIPNKVCGRQSSGR
jgi:hypothetical protein